MPAHRVVASPVEQMRDWLIKSRREGVSFDEAWERALRKPSRPEVGIRFPNPTLERQEWIDVLVETRHEWEAAYNGTVSSVSAVLTALAGGWGDDSSGESDGAPVVALFGVDELVDSGLPRRSVAAA